MKLTTLAIASMAVFGAALLGAAEASAGDSCGGSDTVKSKAAQMAPKVFDQAPAVGARATCPVMGGEFTVTAGSTRSEYKGKHYVFCCPGCKPQFDANPAKYVN